MPGSRRDDQIAQLREACLGSKSLLQRLRHIIDNPDLADVIPEHIRIVLVEAMEETEAKLEKALSQSDGKSKG